jgi:hypothetical protein
MEFDMCSSCFVVDPLKAYIPSDPDVSVLRFSIRRYVAPILLGRKLECLNHVGESFKLSAFKRINI